MNSALEIPRLQDLLPASWRMTSHISHKSDQVEVIASTPLLPWANITKVTINFKLWSQLAQSHRDLLLIREVALRQEAKWFKFGLYQAVTLAAACSAIAEFVQTDPLGIAVSSGLAAFTVNQIWRKNRGGQIQLEADTETIKVATRRGYTEIAAAKALLEAIPAIARLEGRSTLDFTELIRCQNLRVIAKLSTTTVPDELE